MRHTNGFTLIELLVVVTIIVVLLALLVPAMERAIYQAELAVCGANLDAAGSGVITYAMSHKRRYPYRPVVYDTQAGNYQADQMTLPFSRFQNNNVDGYDDRPALAGYVMLKSLVCPMAGGIDLAVSPPTTWVFSNYAMWWGWKYRADPRGMLKVGDRLGWGQETFNVLAADHTHNLPYLFGGGMESTHPDDKGVLSLNTKQDEMWDAGNAVNLGDPDGRVTRSTWGFTFEMVGRTDLNYLFDDGSVLLYAAVDHHVGLHPDLTDVPNYIEHTNSTDFFQMLPRGR